MIPNKFRNRKKSSFSKEDRQKRRQMLKKVRGKKIANKRKRARRNANGSN